MEKEDNDIRFINKSKRKDDFLIISNRGFIRDTRLSLKAKGLLTLMLTNKEDWLIHLNEIINHSKDGESALKTGSKELIECKYMRKIKERDEKGHFKSTLYYIYDEPFDDSNIPVFTKTQDDNNPQGDFPLVDYPPVENQRLTNINNNNINNIYLDDFTKSSNGKDISYKDNADDFFNSLWVLYPKKKGKGGVSKSKKQVLQKVGYDEMKRCIERYIKWFESTGNSEQFMMYGSTFFNSGYVDYLDENYENKDVITQMPNDDGWQ